MTLDKELLEILACPESKSRLVYFEEENFLFCPECRLKYPIRDGIPVMLKDEAERLDEAQAAELTETARRRDLL